MSTEKKKFIVSADDVETQVFPWGRLNWLSEPRVTGTEKMATGLVSLEVGKGHDSHNHDDCEEILYIISGTGEQTIELEEETIKQTVKPGDLIYVPADAVHSTINTGKEKLIFIAVYEKSGPEAFLRSLPDCTVQPPKNG